MVDFVFTVSEIANYLTGKFRKDALLQGIQIKGEISNLNWNSAGTLFFSLKDGQSLLDCIWFDAADAGVDAQMGDNVVATGDLTYFKKSGRVYFSVQKTIKQGIGQLAADFIKLKNELAELGAFDVSRKRPIPKLPLRVGVVTSATGAVLHDILTVSKRRFEGIHFYIYTSKVQGEGAALSVAAGVDTLSSMDMVDVIIVARGGGSSEDLSIFNTKEVVMSVMSSRVPVVSAVGHETDFTLCDLAADVRAATPSMAAEICVPEKARYLQQLQTIQENLAKAIRGKIQNARYELDIYRSQLTALMPREKYQMMEMTRQELQRRLKMAILGKVRERRGQLEALQNTLEALDIQKILERGFAMVQKAGKTVKNAGEIAPEDELILWMNQGKILVKVKEVQSLK